MPAKRSSRAVTRLTIENIERLAQGKPMKMRRGRLGVWTPGHPPLPMRDIHPARYRSEEVEGKTLINMSIGAWWADRLIHIPNGGGRSATVRRTAAGKTVRYSVEAASLKAQGVRSGVPDYLLPISVGDKRGLWIELKASDGYPSDNQLQWAEFLIGQGYDVVFAYGADAAFAAIKRYLLG